MARVASEIVVEAPLSEVYNQWTQFESFPSFMENVKQVEQIDDRRLRWYAHIGQQDVQWVAEIKEQVPDDKIIWTSINGAMNTGMVRFDKVGANETRVHLELSYEPEGVLQHLADKLGALDREVEGDLERFKEFIEGNRGMATGAWRGEIGNPNAPGGHTDGRGSPGEQDR